MSDYEIECAGNAFEHALKVGAPGIGEDIRRAILNNAIIRLRHQFNLPAKLKD